MSDLTELTLLMLWPSNENLKPQTPHHLNILNILHRPPYNEASQPQPSQPLHVQEEEPSNQERTTTYYA